MFYSKLSKGFYHKDIHGKNIPEDAIEITDKKYQSLMEKQSKGHIIVADENGKPIAIQHPVV